MARAEARGGKWGLTAGLVNGYLPSKIYVVLVGVRDGAEGGRAGGGVKRGLGEVPWEVQYPGLFMTYGGARQSTLPKHMVQQILAARPRFTRVVSERSYGMRGCRCSPRVPDTFPCTFPTRHTPSGQRACWGLAPTHASDETRRSTRNESPRHICTVPLYTRQSMIDTRLPTNQRKQQDVWQCIGAAV